MELRIHQLVWMCALAILGAFLGAPAARAQACCAITAINTSTGVVSGKLNSTGATFIFKLSNPQGLSALSVGQGVYANFTTHQISLDGKSIAGSMVAAVAAPAVAALPSGVKGSPCCTITAINSATAVVAARQNANSQTFQFKVDPKTLQFLKVGMAVSFTKLPTATSTKGPGPRDDNLSMCSGQQQLDCAMDSDSDSFSNGQVEEPGTTGVAQGGVAGVNAGGTACNQCEVAAEKTYKTCLTNAGSNRTDQQACLKVEQKSMKSCPCR